MSNEKAAACRRVFSRRLGISLLELVIVLTIIAMLVTLLLPAIQMVREASRISACNNNLRQLVLGMQGYIDIHHFIPGPPVESHPSGWALELLPFVEEIPLRNSFDTAQVIVTTRNLTAAANRPEIFVCPEAGYRPSTVPGIGVTNYLMMVDMKERPRFWKDRSWLLRDAPEGSRYPWCLSPEKDFSPEGKYPAPHPTTPFGF